MASKIMMKKTYGQILALCEKENIHIILKEEGGYMERKTYSMPLADGGEYEFYTYVQSTKIPSIMGRFNNSTHIRNSIKGNTYNDKWNFHCGDCEELKTKFINFLKYLQILNNQIKENQYA